MDPKLVILIEQYKSARDELLKRLPVHYTLIIYKLISVGAIVSFFASQLGLGTNHEDSLRWILQMSVWIAPLIATIFDLLIFRNFRLASLLREYLVSYIQKRFQEVDEHFVIWEQRVRDYASTPIARVPLTQFLVPLVSSLTLGFSVAIRVVQGWTAYDYLLFLLIFASHIYAWFYLAQSRFWGREGINVPSTSPRPSLNSHAKAIVSNTESAEVGTAAVPSV